MDSNKGMVLDKNMDMGIGIGIGRGMEEDIAGYLFRPGRWKYNSYNKYLYLWPLNTPNISICCMTGIEL